MNSRFAIAFAAVILALPCLAGATTIHVPSDQPTIQAGITAAVAGDTVLVACGTYYEFNIIMASGITLRSQWGFPYCVTIDAQNQSRVINCSYVDNTARIEGFTIKDGWTAHPDLTGGGIHCDHSSPVISNCVFYSNRAHRGGGVKCQNSSSPTIVNCDFYENWGGGGGIYCRNYSHPTITGCTFRGNNGDYSGGAIGCYDHSHPYISYCTLYGNLCNSAEYGGSAMSCAAFSEPSMVRCIIAFGTAAPTFNCFSYSTVTLTCCDLYGNAGGDYVGCASGQNGVRNNFSDDPLFVDAANDDFRLRWCSPCADAPGCGLIGAKELGPAPQVWHVPGDAPTIQAGIDLAGACDTVRVAAGTYYEHDILVKSGIYLVSETGTADCVTIDADSLGRVFLCSSLSTKTIIEGFTITGGLADGASPDNRGGGMYCENASITLTRCVFASNSAIEGGGLCCYSCSPTLVECDFSGNDAWYGGPGWGGALFCSGSSPQVTTGVFSSNSAGYGGGVHCTSYSSPTFTNCTFYGHAASSSGGTIASYGSSSPAFVNTILSFTTGQHVVYCEGSSSASLTCCDVFGTDYDDWTSCIADQEDINGNFSIDPVFFDPDNEDFRLCWCSPCADAPGCGLVGARGLGPVAPRLWDVPLDAPTIQAGIDSATNCDTVRVAAGTYHEHDIAMKSSIHLMSETGEADCVTIDADSLGRVFYCNGVASTATIEGFTITGGYATGSSSARYGGGVYLWNSSPHLRNCVLSDNVAATFGGGMYCGNSSPELTNCVFLRNSEHNYGGGGLACEGNGSPVLTGCTFEGNSAAYEGGAAACYGGDPTFSNCTFFDNLADWSGAMALYNTGATLTGCTVCGNSGDVQIYLENEYRPFTMANTIVAFSPDGYGFIGYSYDDMAISCCDIYGNAEGDWVGYIEEYLGLDGNISEDPGFCDLASGNLHLGSASSPCAPHTAPNWECDLIGAWPVGCDWAGMTSITDVPNDQGRRVYATWGGHTFDQPSTPYTITEYSLWRRLDEQKGNNEPEAPSKDLRYPPGNWVFLKTVPASGETVYSALAPTACDSTITQGVCWSVFFVRAHTDDPLVYFDCDPDSGYSVDNLRPDIPRHLMAQGGGESVVLQWFPNLEHDIYHYCVYRGTDEGFEPDVPIGFAPLGTYTDDDVPGAGEYWYKVTAVDFGGNESDPSDPASAMTTGVFELVQLPSVFFLGPAVPNPFNPITEISYGIPAGATPSRVVMSVYDATGREVTRLVEADQGPGEYRVVWNGRDHKGAAVASGVYFYRLAWQGKSETRRMVLLK